MAEKKHKNDKWKRLRKSIICRLKEELEFIDVKIMSYVLSVVLMISIVAATVAWFLISSSTKISQLNLTTGSTEDIEVSLAMDPWQDVLESNSNPHTGTTAEIQIAMPAFENIYDKSGNKVETANSGIMAPGTYGEFTFYVKSVNELYDGCQLTISKVLESAASDSIVAEINRLAEGHILCFAKVVGDTEYHHVSEEHPMELIFTYSEGQCQPLQVQVYWVWPYEYVDLTADIIKIGELSIGTAENPMQMYELPAVNELPQTLSATGGDVVASGCQLAANQVFEWTRYNTTINEFLNVDTHTQEEMLIDWYDYADTLIGTHVENVIFHIGVKGVVSDE